MSHHVVPVRVYLTVFGSLMILMILTFVAARINLGLFNDVVAMAVAVSKTLLILLYFMHLRYSSRLTWVFAGVGFLFFIILVSYTLADYFTRGGFSPVAPTLGNPYDPLGG
jgi:cytochrome c oxidase subunit 4